jgi:aminoglycoside 2'-N-acetyltransferase I
VAEVPLSMPTRLVSPPRLVRSDALDERTRGEIRALLDAAFDDDFSDDDWAHALGGTHALIVGGDAVIAHASIVPRILDAGGLSLHAGYVEAVAVLPTLQRTGLGSAVMRALVPIIERDYDVGALSSGEWHFYGRLGWERWRGPTWVRHADGRRERTPDDDDGLMILRTPRTPGLDLAVSLTCGWRPGDVW